MWSLKVQWISHIPLWSWHFPALPLDDALSGASGRVIQARDAVTSEFAEVIQIIESPE